MDELDIITKKRGKFLFEIIKIFRHWRGPENQHFSNQFIVEILMGNLAKAWATEIEEDKKVTDNLTAALASNKSLTDINAQLTTQLQAGGVATVQKTPNGYVLDTDDLATVDAIIQKHPPVPVIPA